MLETGVLMRQVYAAQDPLSRSGARCGVDQMLAKSVMTGVGRGSFDGCGFGGCCFESLGIPTPFRLLLPAWMR